MAVIVPFESPGKPASDPLVDLLAADMERVNAVILTRTGSDVTMIPEVANHLINSGGKRLRPMLTLALARLTGLFGILALILASVGLYGVMSYFVVRRTGEIGIRMALGATRSSVIGIVLRGVIWQVGLGLVIGIPAALFAGHLMASQLYGVGAYDPLAFAAATVVLAICAGFAGFIPARRAASIEPMQALRTE